MARIILSGYIDFDGKDVMPILRGARDMIAAAYAEKGCIHYVWTADPQIESRMWVYEEWESVDDLKAHLADEAYRSMAAYLAEAGMTGAEVNKYRVDAKEPVYDGSGSPQADFAAP